MSTDHKVPRYVVFSTRPLTRKLLHVKAFGGQVCNFAQTEKKNVWEELEAVSETEEILFKKSRHVACR